MVIFANIYALLNKYGSLKSSLGPGESSQVAQAQTPHIEDQVVDDGSESESEASDESDPKDSDDSDD